MRLPNGDQAEVDIAKLTEYALNPGHPKGGAKARLFAALLGFTKDNADDFRKILLQVAKTEDVTSRPPTAYGQPYDMKANVIGPKGSCVVVTITWFIDVGKNHPRLVTCYIEKD